MIFGILGPLLVEDSEGPRTLAAPKQRVLLASLLLRPNRVVPVADLLDRLWGEHHPASATATLHNHVARLRRSLGSEAGARVRTRAPGYLVEILDDRELDLARFQELRTTAAAAAQEGDLHRAAALLRQALGLWRGNALSDVPAGEPHAADAEQLDELRLAVWQQRIEYDLAGGAGEALLPELRELLAAHPFQENLYGQLMRALYRSGRQADALDVFRKARAALLDELGVEPGPALQQLHESLLRQDPGLAGEPAVQLRPPQTHGRPEPLRAPLQLPPGVTDFTGRQEECAAVIAALTADGGHGPRIVAVSGQAGIGKTELALQTAWRLRAAFTDGVLFADLRGRRHRPADPAEVLAAFARALGAPESAIPADPEACAALYHGLAAGRRLLVVLDDAADSSQVRPLLPGPGSAVLVTGRRRLTGLAGAQLVDLGLLPQAEAAELFRRVAGRGFDEPDAVAAITTWCGRLPLALRIAGARLAARPAWSVREIAERLADRRHRMDELRAEDMDVRASLMLSYTALPGPNARAFRLLALADAPTLPLPIAAAVLDLPQRGAERILEELVDAHLLTCPQPGCYAFHELPRLFGKELAAATETASERLAAVRRGARAALVQVGDVEPSVDAAVDASVEVENTCAWIRQLFCAEETPVAADLLDAMAPPLAFVGFEVMTPRRPSPAAQPW
ncbi:AfsR/SARP family transcriptional regulator [Kitasatospora viridis]|uniref:DNA-binding SARP family transcriptional activator n=1 Tax=Kitasatospora viridis TaxID=281105 RepID=A0A561TTX3_9ACTN|nr:AfsR/SARP family transcriptional regulator [Kitasatospora viridis]TWF90524.1 DNA-binding SARP family transcriptional activator [Kitasatospora viridis]